MVKLYVHAIEQFIKTFLHIEIKIKKYYITKYNLKLEKN